MAVWNVGQKNGMWKKGRTTTSHGYVLIRVGKGNHLADCRGYAYEHRIVAESMLGRPLTDKEQVHHVNGDTSDNRPENLQVTEDLKHHRFIHRVKRTGRRHPDEPNPTVECACGCGATFPRYDATGRPRSYVSGHNPSASETQDKVIELLSNSPMKRSDMAVHFASVRALATALSKMKQMGLVRNIKHGTWALGAEDDDGNH